MNSVLWVFGALMWPGDITLKAGNRKFVMDYSLKLKLLTLFNPLVSLPSPPVRRSCTDRQRANISQLPTITHGRAEECGSQRNQESARFRLWSISSSPKKKNQMSFMLRCARIKCVTVYGVFPFWHRVRASEWKESEVTEHKPQSLIFFSGDFKVFSAQTCKRHCFISWN